MVAVVGLVVAWVLIATLLAPTWRRIGNEHTIAGLLGEGRREALISRWSDRVVATAERYERLDDFRRHLAGRAWDGTPLRIEKGRAGWYRWHFTDSDGGGDSDGDVWEVRHVERPPKTVARLIVGRSGDAGQGLSVQAYVPGSHDVVLPIDDARHR